MKLTNRIPKYPIVEIKVSDFIYLLLLYIIRPHFKHSSLTNYA